MTGQPTARPDDTATLRLVTLGGAGLYSAETPDLILGPGKPLALLSYLALTPGRRVSREFLLDLLWADLDPDRGRPALRQVLFHLRRLLGDASLPGTEELILARPIETDRDRFLAAVESGELEGALAAYTGPFLAAFGVPGGAAFEQWADLERDRLRAAFLRCGELLVRRYLNQSRTREAQHLARRIRDEVPEAEAGWRLVLEAAVTGRDFVTAAVEAEALEQWAIDESVTLEPATRLAIARARQVSPVAGDPPGDSRIVAELTGREREFWQIVAGWEAARSGAARHLHLSAPAGLGKTRLLRDAVARLRAIGASVVESRGSPGERDIPYTLAGEVAAAIATLPGATGIAPASAAALVALNPTLSSWLTAAPDTAAGEEAMRRWIQALGDLVRAVADSQPFALVIDDLHWSDAASFRLLEGLFERLGASHVLCLTAGRPERLPGGEGTVRIPLAPLTSTGVHSLVSAIGTIPVDAPWSRDFVAGMHQATRGSPLLVLETLRLGMDEGVLALENGEWHCVAADRLASLLQAGEALRQRIRSLPEGQQWLLALLATAGTPLAPGSLGSARKAGPGDLADEIRALERLGLVMPVGALLAPAHDEIAAAAREALTPGQGRDADRAIGRMLVDSAAGNLHRLFRGVRLLAAAGDEGEVQQQFRNYARVARDRGDRRSFVHLAAELLSLDAESARVKALAGTLPRQWRMGLWSPARQGVAAAVTVIAAVSAVAIPARGARDESLQRLVYLDSTRTARFVPVRLDEWDGRTEPLVPDGGRSDIVQPALAFPEIAPAISPDGRSVAWIQDSGDSTTLDVWLRTPTGTRRLTWEPRDDLVHGWLPDGSGLVGATNRWTDPAVGGYDIAVFDTSTGAARAITRGRGHHGAPSVSPDGTRIAFIRQGRDGVYQICIATIDGEGEPECRLPGGQAIAALLGWVGLVELAIVLDSVGTRPLVRYDWQRDHRATLLGPHFYGGRLSPDRRWVAGAVQVEGMRGFRDWIIPVDRPSQARRVEGPGAGPAGTRWWEGRPDRSMLIHRIEFADTTRLVLLGVGARLTIRAFTEAGTEIPVRAPVRWRSQDTLIATVDSMGDVRTLAAGTVTIEASLAGWRSASRRLEVVGQSATTVLRESWQAGWQDRWITFGEPAPEVEPGPAMIPGFWNRGDGSFPSMGILRQGLDGRRGLGVELRLSTPVRGGNWESARTEIIAGLDPDPFRGADQRKAPPSVGRQEQTCGVSYPSGAGEIGQATLAVTGGVAGVIGIAEGAEVIGSGRWWTLRIQLLPDGRCAVAVNGKVVWISPVPIPLDGEFRLRLGDESAGTRLLHGPLEIWTGVRTDIDWSRREAR